MGKVRGVLPAVVTAVPHYLTDSLFASQSLSRVLIGLSHCLVSNEITTSFPPLPLKRNQKMFLFTNFPN